MTLIDQERSFIELHSETLRVEEAGESGRRAQRLVVILASLAAAWGAIVSLVGLLWRGTGAMITSVTIFGERVELYGKGLYEYDTLFFAGNNLATDLVTLFLGVPLVAVAIRLSRRGSSRGRLLLLGGLGYLLYNSSTYALGGVAFNELFLAYVVFFSTSLFAFVLCFMDLRTDPVHYAKTAPRRLAGVFMVISGLVTAVIWLMEPVVSLVSGEVPPSLETHTTLFTHALDLAIIVPAAIAIGLMILKGHPFGYTAAFSLLILEALLLPLITIGTLAQLELGIEFEPPEIVGPIAGFSILAAFASWVIARILRAVPTGGASAVTHQVEVSWRSL